MRSCMYALASVLSSTTILTSLLLPQTSIPVLYFRGAQCSQVSALNRVCTVCVSMQVSLVRTMCDLSRVPKMSSDNKTLRNKLAFTISFHRCTSPLK